MPHVKRYSAWTLALGAVLACQLLGGCREQPSPDATPGQSVSHTTSEAPVAPVTPLTDERLSLEDGAELMAAVERSFETKPPEAMASYEELATFVETAQEEMSNLPEDEQERHQAILDRLVPGLQEFAGKPAYAPTGELNLGNRTLDYRALRDLIMLAMEPADQLWASGQKAEALQLVELPLALAHAMQQHPESVSVHLFSASYAGLSLAQIDRWLNEGPLDPEELQTLSEVLARYRPSLSHLEQTVSLDFAQIANSLADDELRAKLRLGLVSDEQLARWNEELQQIHLKAVELYRSPKLEIDPFNDAVRSVSPQLQGLIIDYPEVLTMQRRWYALYLATEIVLGLERGRGPDGSPPSVADVADSVFADDPTVPQHLSIFLEAKTADGRVELYGQPDMFHLISPEGGLPFYLR